MVRLGVVPPLNLIPPNDENPKGFSESTVIVGLNDEILAAGGSHWDDWHPFDPGRIRLGARVHAEDASKIRPHQGIRRGQPCGHQGPAHMPAHVLLVLRCCRIADGRSRALLPLRSPLEVALSLDRRDGIPLSLGCLIWLRHVLDAETGTRICAGPSSTGMVFSAIRRASSSGSANSSARLAPMV